MIDRRISLAALRAAHDNGLAKISILVVALVLVAPTAGAITILFEGQIDYIDGPFLTTGGPGGTLPADSYPVGTPFSGSLSFDEATADGDPSVERGFYGGAISAFSVTIGGDSFAASTGDVEVFPNFADPIDASSMGPVAGPMLNEFSAVSIGLEFADPGDLVTDDSLASATDLVRDGLLGTDSFAIVFLDGGTTGVSYEALGCTYSVIPEPGPAILIAMGLAWLGRRESRA